MSNFIGAGAAFIDGNFIPGWLVQSDETVNNLDAFDCGGNLEKFRSLDGDAQCNFIKGDIGGFNLVTRLFVEHRHSAGGTCKQWVDRQHGAS